MSTLIVIYYSIKQGDDLCTESIMQRVDDDDYYDDEYDEDDDALDEWDDEE